MNLRDYAAQAAQGEQEVIKAPVKIAREQQEQQAAHERAAEVYKEWQQNKIHSNQIVAEINKGLQSGEDLTALFLKAMRVISLLTHNELTYRGAAQRIKDNYNGSGK